MNQSRCKELKSAVDRGCKTLTSGFFTVTVEKAISFPSGDTCSTTAPTTDMKSGSLDLAQGVRLKPRVASLNDYAKHRGLELQNRFAGTGTRGYYGAHQ